MNAVTTFPAMNGTYQDQRQWLESLLKRLGITATELARRADLNPSTLTRFLNSEGNEGHTLTFRTIRKIENAVGKARQPGSAAAQSITGFSEAEAQPWDHGSTPDQQMASAVRALIGARNACHAFTIGSDDLHALGIHAGDVLVVDTNEAARPGDIVCAQVNDLPAGGARTVFRLYEPPYLISGSAMPGVRRPVIVDGVNASISGVVIGRLSPRQALAHHAA